MGKTSALLAAAALVGMSAAHAVSLPVTYQYEVFQSASSDLPVGTIITLELDFAGGLPAETAPPYDSQQVGEDQLASTVNSRFDDLATATITFSNSGRTINGTLGAVLTFNGSVSAGDTFRVSFTDDGEDGLSAGNAGDLEFFVDSQATDRTVIGVTAEFKGPNTLLSTQYIGDALDTIDADPFAWTGVVGSGETTQAPRRLQFVFGPPGSPEINATLVPVPAAVWLFGSALGLLGWIRRRAA
jgi:hypothetical protein